MTCAEQLANFVVKQSSDDLAADDRIQLKIRVLDSLGCAVSAMEGEPIKKVREEIAECSGPCSLIGWGWAGPDRAAFYNGALVRFEIEWSLEGVTCVGESILKTHNAEIHSQTANECALQLRAQEDLVSTLIEHIEVETFDVAENIIDGGEEGDKSIVSTKEEADRSLPSVVSVALLDKQVMPEQCTPERISCRDVRELLQKDSVHPVDAFSDRFPNEMPRRLILALREGRVLSKEPHDYPGFVTQPMSWETALEKFNRVAGPFSTSSLRRSIANAVKNVESIQVKEVTQLLQKVERVHRKDTEHAA